MIITFYSFKGGVGRSMALANVAELLYQHGLNVLMLDFDLEAPGLERYFDVPNVLHTPAEIADARGIIDILLSYKELRLLTSTGTNPEEVSQTHEQSNFPHLVEPVANFIMPIYGRNSSGGSLSIMPAGRRSEDEYGKYANRIRGFDWNDFYLQWDGEAFFEWFRAELEQSTDVVLIDSRTGVTEMSGVCTYQLADVVVLLIGSNQQSIEGTVRMAQSLTDPLLLREGRKGRPLSLLFVPGRVEQGEKALLDKFEEEFNDVTDSFARPSLQFERSAFIDLKIPYVPYYAYMENVAVRERDRASASDMVSAFENLILSLRQMAPAGHPLRTYGPPEQILNDSRVEIAVWGATGAGKTTYLSALHIASLLEPTSNWLMTGIDRGSAQFLTASSKLLSSGRFPIATPSRTNYGFNISGDLEPRWLRLFRGLGLPRSLGQLVRNPRLDCDLHILDAPGGDFQKFGRSNDWFLRQLETSQGIIYLYDMLSKSTDYDNYGYLSQALQLLYRTMMRHNRLIDGRLPHYIAVCLAKFDEPLIFDKLAEFGLLELALTGTMNPFEEPVVTDPKRAFELCADKLTTAMISRYFSPSRTAYFAVSSIGFYSSDGISIDKDDLYNIISTPEGKLIRGTVRPVNVIEPVLWLTSQMTQPKR